MIFSCKCLNFIATSGVSGNKNDAEDRRLPDALKQNFFRTYPKNFVFYSQCMDFFKQTIGPLTDLTINALSQRDLIFSLTLELPSSTSLQSWQLSICVNCNTALCAKLLQPIKLNSEQSPQQQQQQQPQQQQLEEYFINSELITSNEELSHRRSDHSFSEAFGVVIMDHPAMKTPTTPTTPTPPFGNNGTSTTFTIGSAPSNATNSNNKLIDFKQQRTRQLQQHLQQILIRETAATCERIQRFTDQQFALLKSFREKSEQECELLARLIQKVPEQNVGCGELWLDRLPPALKVNDAAGAFSFAVSSRRRNTISSRRDLNSLLPSLTVGNLTGTTTTTTPLTTPNIVNIGNAPVFPIRSAVAATNNAAAVSAHTATTTTTTSAIVGTINNNNNNNNNSNSNNSNNTNTNTNVVVGVRKLSNFDTPPATPEATPMSVGNSPTFRQQQQQQLQQSQTQLQQPTTPQNFGGINNVRLLTSQMSFQQQFPTPTQETADDCIFELEGVESTSTVPKNFNFTAADFLRLDQQQKQQQQQQQYERTFGNQHHRRAFNQHYMGELDERDAEAEEAEDALDMDSSLPIPNNNNNSALSAHMLNFAKSLPIEIANSPLAERGGGLHAPIYNQDSDEDVLDNIVDIASSIKALAKSVHGEAVFGDLPRPRIRKQI